ncbi:accessory gene regulator B family protein [Desulfitobacterium sp.]|uniref:accessory gene regulator B family protein n=1 Tax=Desulfitobacterium sp. TaxID=49981 RepID=UPI002B208BE7|nr:accessory gene regulator B family protein [Desulfitobacterium sp.]MEA4902311.1 accessory gene regulator B family protein [Desulfitobacterium sp.]
MFDLESVSHRMTNRLLKEVEMDPIQKAKAEYGLSLVLGVASELILTVGAAFFLGTALYTFMIMISALALRIFSGGAHCSSFRRCFVFTLVVFIAASLLIKAMVLSMEFNSIIGISLLLAGVSLFLMWRPKRSAITVWVVFGLALPIIGLLTPTYASGLEILALSSTVGITIQAFMGNAYGEKFVLLSDNLMKQLRI